MSADAKSVGQVVDALGPVLGLAIDAEMKPHVVTHLEIAFKMATLLADFTPAGGSADHMEPASIYSLGGQTHGV